MKIYINLLKFFIIFLLLPILFTTSCDILNTYSEDDYLALGEKDKEYNGSNSIEIALEDYNYTINNGGSFSFDNIPAIQRTSQIIFKIYNNGSKPLELTGDPKIEINSIADFTLDQNITNTTIHPDSWALFMITYTSTATDGQVKTAIISIPNNSEDNNPFTFTVSCTAKELNTIEFKNTGSTNWIFPVHSITGDILLVGAGGGGGYGSSYTDIFGNTSSSSGGGGGAGEVTQDTLTLEYNQLYTIVIGDGGTGGADDNDPIYEGDGGNGSASQIIFNGNIILSADYGRGGEGGCENTNANGGIGYPIPPGIGQNGGSSDGGNGGYNNFGGLDSKGIGGNVSPTGGDTGSPGSPNTGAGGGGGGGANAPDPGGEGGSGGSGYCRIQYIGFSIP